MLMEANREKARTGIVERVFGEGVWRGCLARMAARVLKCGSMFALYINFL